MNQTKDSTEIKQKSSGSYHRHKNSHHSHHNHHHSSKRRRTGDNTIYDSVRKERINQMFKRSIFLIIATAVIIFIVYFMTKPEESFSDFELFNNGISEQEINELKNKITEYEFYIDELEERLSKYEEVESIFEKK